MSQSNYDVPDEAGALHLATLNNLMAAIVSQNSGATEPATTFAYQVWADTDSGILKMRNDGNSAWINVYDLTTGKPYATGTPSASTFLRGDGLWSGVESGSRNKIINPFTENQRGLSSVGDDAYCCDLWYVLTESGNVSYAMIADPEAGAPSAIRLTQPDATAKRMGIATIIEAKDIKPYRGAAMNFASRVKPSFAGNVRYAILEHTGTADTVTSDVVNNWASTTFTAGNFFIAGVNVLKTGVIAPGAATYGDLSDWSALGAATNNIILFVWTESAQAQNATLELNRPQYEPGVIRTLQEWRPNERALCQRYFYKCPMAILARGYGNVGETNYTFPVTMRVTPTLVGSVDSADATSVSITPTADGVIFKATFGTTSSSRYGYSADWTADAGL